MATIAAARGISTNDIAHMAFRFSKGPMDSGWGELPACAVVRITAASGLADKDVNHMVFLCHHWANVLLEELTMASGFGRAEACVQAMVGCIPRSTVSGMLHTLAGRTTGWGITSFGIFCLLCEGEERLPPLPDSPNGLFVF
uniref:Uncharacterized protein n=1 Tax=Oryza sativa subsp. japonica TaxID=39947 RepID=Q94HX2_ORYSJ|nr:hypothetical protein [Oryza sativa Japonica Group]